MPDYSCINVTKLYSKDTKSRFYYGHTNMLMNNSIPPITKTGYSSMNYQMRNPCFISGWNFDLTFQL